MTAEKLPRLPAGRHGLPADVVAANQRQRLIDAMARVVVEKGIRAATVADITSRASVSRNVFYEQFGGKDECLIAAYDQIRDHVVSRMDEGAGRHEHPAEKLVAALREMLAFYSSQPELARLCFLEPMSAGPAMASHHEDTIGFLVTYLHATATGSGEAAPARDEIIILGAVALIVRRINLGEASTLVNLVPELSRILLSPYFSEDEVAAAIEAAAGPAA